MIRKIVIVFFLLHLTPIVLAQHSPDSLNKVINGKKQGFWIQYLDSLIKPTDFENAKYYRLIYYHKGKLNKFFLNGFSKKYTVKYNEQRQRKSEPLSLEGTYTFIRQGKHAVQKFEETYEQGQPVMFKQYEGDELFEFCDFKKQYNNIPGTFYFETGGKDQVKGYYREGEKGWTFYYEK